jgi:hypothetical protein
MPEPFEQPAGLVAHRLRSDPHDLCDRSAAIDCREDSVLSFMDRKGEVGVGVGPIDQDGHETGGHSVPDAQGPRQTRRNVFPPGITVERDRLAVAEAIVAIGDEVVLGHGPAQQLDRGVLQWRRKREQTSRMWRPRDCPALREIGSLLEPAPERSEERDEIKRIIMEELVCGVFKAEAVAYFQRVYARMKDAGCDAVVLGCTEIPLIMNDANSPLPTLDSTRLLARAALRRAVAR